MTVRAGTFLGRMAVVAKNPHSLLRVRVSPRWARFLIAAGARSAAAERHHRVRPEARWRRGGARTARRHLSSRRSDVLELAVLGLLHDIPMDGYELRERLNPLLGAFRAWRYGPLYPCLKDLTARGLIAENTAGDLTKPLAGRRSKIAYWLTADGKEYLRDLLGETRADVRLRILEGRRSWLEERVEAFRAGLARGGERADRYTLELQQQGLESVEREVRWLNELIASERPGTSERESS